MPAKTRTSKRSAPRSSRKAPQLNRRLRSKANGQSSGRKRQQANGQSSGRKRQQANGRSPGRRTAPLTAKTIRQNPFTLLLSDVRADIDARMSGFFDAKVDAAKKQGADVEELVRAVRDLCLRGGKRMRPALVVAGYRAANQTADLEPALDAGVALELLHGYFLIHDDWMDGDAVRRGGPAVHASLSKRYRSQKLGESSAILAGDLGVALSTEALSRIDVPAKRLARALATFAQMQVDAVAGQQLDVLGRSHDVEKVYTLKTGSYTVRGPLVLGAQLAGASPRLITALERFALPVGVAFQLRDDLLSVFGDPAATGKPFANDIKSGKRTVLITTAITSARGKDRARLKAAWGNPRAKRSELRDAVGVLEDSGARAKVEARIEELVDSGLSALKSAKLTRTGEELLVGAAQALADRQA